MATVPNTQLQDSLNFTICQSWDGDVPKEKGEFNVRIFLRGKQSSSSTHAHDDGLVIQVDAPLFNNPPPPHPPGSTPQLWDYEVVEFFFLGEDDKYLEVELGPHGHFLLLQLHGYRNTLRESLSLDEPYITRINGEEGRWVGEAVIPFRYFPPNVHSFNAYAIYNSPERVYMSLHPADKGSLAQPDFHRLQYFKPINLPELGKLNEHFPCND